jgi:small subunit ribosomal protein S4
MSSPKFPSKKYETPLHPWKENRIKAERELIKKYGLKNHTEVWKAKTYLGKNRHHARELLAKVSTPTPQVKKESDQLLNHLTHMGILPMGSGLDDVLAIDIDTVLNRRLQTLVYLKGFSSTPYQARQLISHGHIAIGPQKVTIPGYMVPKEEETLIQYTMKSPLNELSHPARPKIEGVRLGTPMPAAPAPTPAPASTPAAPQPAAAASEAPRPALAAQPAPTTPPRYTEPRPKKQKKPAPEKIEKPAEKTAEKPAEPGKKEEA